MNWETLAWIAVGFALLPFLVFVANSFVYRPLPPENHDPSGVAGKAGSIRRPVGVSVLIPARNEEGNIASTLESVLASTEVDLELIVLDDHSTDRTAAIVREFQAQDPRVRLESAPALPAGWCGKQHACSVLAQLASRPWLVFVDADVRLEPRALLQMVRFMDRTGADLASGVPRQETGTFCEKLLIPLIHFVLLGFLPMHAMRQSRSPSFAAGCGQLFVARRQAYRQCGGHARIPTTLHDGLRLPKVFRQSGFKTDLFDATSMAVCRMYRTGAEVWRGLAKNATEGLAAPKRIVPMTLLLVGGQVLPWIVALGGWSSLGDRGRALALLAVAVSMIPRFVAARWFRQSLLGAILHPIGVLVLLAIQWFALARTCMGRPSSWKGRDYSSEGLAAPRAAATATGTTLVLGVCLFAAAASGPRLSGAEPASSATPTRLDNVAMEDQFGIRHELTFPAPRITVMTCADRDGAAQIAPWIQAVKDHGFTNRVILCGVADVRKVPSFLRGMVRRRFAERYSHPILMDWKGQIASQPALKAGSANVLLLDRDGQVVRQFSGEGSPKNTQALVESIRALLQASP